MANAVVWCGNRIPCRPGEGVNAYAASVDEAISGAARFDNLLAGILAEAEAADAAALDADIAEVERAVRAESRLLDRLRAQRRVALDIVGMGTLVGDVAVVGRDVVVLAADDGDWAVPIWGIAAVIDPAPGVLVARRELFANRVPDVPGGGTVRYVNPTEHEHDTPSPGWCAPELTSVPVSSAGHLACRAVQDGVASPYSGCADRALPMTIDCQ